jgi:DNA-binding transcriptional regulator GbsR (MarR family)
MAFEDIKAAIGALLDEIQHRPEDRHILQEQLREKISELEAMGLEVPEDLKRLEEELSEDNADELFNNMPV